jgi:hypothetical protein
MRAVIGRIDPADMAKGAGQQEAARIGQFEQTGQAQVPVVLVAEIGLSAQRFLPQHGEQIAITTVDTARPSKAVTLKGSPPLAQDTQTIAAQQAQIQHHRIIMLGAAQMLHVVACGGDINHEIVMTQHMGKLMRQTGIIFAHQHPHDLAPLPVRSDSMMSFARTASQAQAPGPTKFEHRHRL